MRWRRRRYFNGNGVSVVGGGCHYAYFYFLRHAKRNFDIRTSNLSMTFFVGFFLTVREVSKNILSIVFDKSFSLDPL
jgi:hypothetical protein